MAVPESIGKYFSVKQQFYSCPQLEVANGILYRECMHQGIQHLNAFNTLFVDGQVRAGKSVSLSFIANHFLQNGWIVMHFDCSPWTSGVEPYASSEGGYMQDELASKLLLKLVKLNDAQMKRLQLGKQSYFNAINGGKRDTAMLQDVVQQLLKNQERAPVLICLDEVNAVYSNTAYHDKESNVLGADKFLIPSLFRDILAKPLERASFAAAPDYSRPQIASEWLKESIDAIEPLNTVPVEIDEEPKEYNNQVFKHASRIVLPSYTKEEIEATLKFFQSMSLLHKQIEDVDVQRQFMLTQGRPYDLFRAVRRMI